MKDREAVSHDEPSSRDGAGRGSHVRRTALVLSGLLVIFALFLVPKFVPRFDVGGNAFSRLSINEQVTAVNAVRTTLIQLFGVLAVGLAGYVGWRQLRINQNQVSLNIRQLDDTNEANLKQQDLARQSLVSQRMTSSVEQLGHQEVGVRVGGVYGLELVATSSPNEVGVVIEILSSFVRGNISQVPDPAQTFQLPIVLWTDAPISVPTLGMSDPDRQAALRVLGRQTKTSLSLDNLLDRTDQDRFDLSHSELLRADLKLGRFDGANFRFCDLRGANMSGAFFEAANFAWASLAGANLAGADLRRVDFTHAQLVGAEFDDADLTGAIFHGADLSGVTMDSIRGAEYAIFRAVITDEHSRLPPNAIMNN